MVIGLTDILDISDKLKSYTVWLNQIGFGVEIVTLSHKRNNSHELSRCDLLVLAGGGDVHPEFYNQKLIPKLFKGVMKERDEFEMLLINNALKNNMPILGICRGLQIFNVALGGTLITDLEYSGYKNHRTQRSIVKRHKIEISRESLLSNIVGSGVKLVNTFHHQAIDQIGKGLRVSAKSSDDIIEAAELVNTKTNSSVILIQWHPERMVTSETSKKIIKNFINKIKLN
jgi:putative glutamine amidotransferase